MLCFGLEDRNVNVMENADTYQEAEVVLDTDYEDLAFNCTGCSSPEDSKTVWFASDDKRFLLVPNVCSSIIINSNFMYQTDRIYIWHTCLAYINIRNGLLVENTSRVTGLQSYRKFMA